MTHKNNHASHAGTASRKSAVFERRPTLGSCAETAFQEPFPSSSLPSPHLALSVCLGDSKTWRGSFSSSSSAFGDGKRSKPLGAIALWHLPGSRVSKNSCFLWSSPFPREDREYKLFWSEGCFRHQQNVCLEFQPASYFIQTNSQISTHTDQNVHQTDQWVSILWL